MQYVEVAITHNFPLSELAVVLDVLRTAHRINAKVKCQIKVVSGDSTVHSNSGPVVSAEPLSPASEPLDLLVVIGHGGGGYGQTEPKFIQWLTSRANKAMRIAALPSGAGLLASLGLLEGRRIALHWRTDPIEFRNDGVGFIDKRSLFVHDNGLWTASSSSAAVDMLLEILAADYGPKTAREIGRELTLGQIRSGSEAQQSPCLDYFTGDDIFDRLHGYVRENIRQRLPIEQLAEYCGMSTRTFLRRYREMTGTTPAKAVDRMRAELAAGLLKSGAIPSKRLVQVCGFGSEETMRRSIMRHFGATPFEFRRSPGSHQMARAQLGPLNSNGSILSSTEAIVWQTAQRG